MVERAPEVEGLAGVVVGAGLDEKISFKVIESARVKSRLYQNL